MNSVVLTLQNIQHGLQEFIFALMRLAKNNYDGVHYTIIELQHDKTNKMMCAQRRLRSESSLCTQWAAMDFRFLHADSKD